MLDFKNKGAIVVAVALAIVAVIMTYVLWGGGQDYGPQSVGLDIPTRTADDAEVASLHATADRDSTGLAGTASTGRLSADDEERIKAGEDDSGEKPNKPRKRSRRRSRRRGASDQDDDEEEEAAPPRSAPKRGAPFKRR